MTKKIGRNEPCPCGSGKKYKHCCMLNENLDAGLTQPLHSTLPMASLDAPKIKAYFENHDSSEIFDYLIALQLNPENHGKNMRIERMAQLAISTIDSGEKPIDAKVLKKLMDEEYADDVMEDIPMNMFCENVLFFGGNYPFFPGLSTHVMELYNVMSGTIYRNEDKFSKEFRKEIYLGVTFLLEFGKVIALRSGLSGMTRGNEKRRNLICAPLRFLPYGLPEEEMLRVFSSKGITKDIIDSFVLDKNDPNLLAENIDENPLLYKPIVKYDDAYFFLGIGSQGAAINNYILKKASQFGCLKELVKWTQYAIWMRIGASCVNRMHWQTLEITDIVNTNPNYNEALFDIDTNWIAYVLYAKDTENDVSIDGANKQIRWNIDSHLKTTLGFLCKDERTKDKHILTMVLYSSMGESFLLTMNKQPDSDYLLTFSAFEFLQLIQTEKWDSMSLVRYARTKESTPFINYGRNQNIDCYSLYKYRGENFYLSDEPKPTILQLEPNEGYGLIKSSKELINHHGAPFNVDGRGIAFIPVVRDINYADIYHPEDKSIHAKLCNTYNMPVWIRTSQNEKRGMNPSSFIDTTMTAIAFWMEAMSPSLDKLIRMQYKHLVDINITLDEDVFIDKDFNHEVCYKPTEGDLKVIKIATGVDVFMNRSYLRSFMGADNTSEREMMKAIIISLLNMSEETAREVVDNHIPLGQAKMILTIDPSQIPLTYPLWLYPPIYIHHATEQLMLDKMPLWMKDGGKDFDGKLKTKEEREHFLHDAVDVLLSKLVRLAARYDSKELIIRLVHSHETLVHLREHNKMLHPAQLLCFGESNEKRKEYLEEEQQLTDAGLSTRALIECLASTQNNDGKDEAGSDDIEQMLAIMSEIVHLGGICDAIHYGVSDHAVEKLPSGRYGIYDDGFSDHVSGFVSARSIESVNSAIEGFADRMDQLSDRNEGDKKERGPLYDRIDKAFINDWGVSYSNLLQFLYASYLLAMNKQTSVLEMEEKELVKAILETVPEMNEAAARLCLERLSLFKRADYLTPPDGVERKDISPWCYNRELSFLRRPFVCYQMENGEKHYIFGFRSCLQAGLQLADLLYSGRLKKVGKKMTRLLGFFEDEKGKEFNEIVRAYLNQIPGLKVWSYDVKIKERGHLVADIDYGDIDVLAYDTANNILYSIECKNTNTAKNIREMKTEMDEYLGRGEDPEKDMKKALVLKHLRRHKWLIEHIDQVTTFIGARKKPIIKSMMLTSEVIPTSYLRKEETPLSILNYSKLKEGGLTYLNTSKKPILTSLM